MNSIILQLGELFEKTHKDEKHYPHVVVGAESSPEGIPTGLFLKSNCPPVITLGLLQIIQDKIEDAKIEILEELNNQKIEAEKIHDALESPISKLNQLLETIKPFIGEEEYNRLKTLNDEALKAYSENDFLTLSKVMNDIKMIMDKCKPKSNKKDNGNDFDINDFKSGL